MKNLKKAILAAAITCIMACHKGGNPVTDIPEPPDRQLILVKDIVISNLPSPYYHFEYSDSGKISLASFAADFLITKFDYNKNLVLRSHNSGPANQDQLNYLYDSIQRPIQIDYMNKDGKTYKRVKCMYNGFQLQLLTRSVKIANVFVIEKVMKFTYNPGGNLRRIEQHFPAIESTNQDSASFSDDFEAYDTSINPEGFSLLHDEFFDNLVVIPGIVIQKSNPGKVKRTGDGLNYEITNKYTYTNNNAPLIRSGDILITNGKDAGRHITSNSQFSYYE
jgi:hypothetical protein